MSWTAIVALYGRVNYSVIRPLVNAAPKLIVQYQCETTPTLILRGLKQMFDHAICGAIVKLFLNRYFVWCMSV